MFGFGYATEASASSTMPNCGCNSEWLGQRNNCPSAQTIGLTQTANRVAKSVIRPLVMCGQSEIKVEGDDSMYIVGVFEAKWTWVGPPVLAQSA